jgi:hypothetical protein
VCRYRAVTDKKEEKAIAVIKPVAVTLSVTHQKVILSFLPEFWKIY